MAKRKVNFFQRIQNLFASWFPDLFDPYEEVDPRSEVEGMVRALGEKSEVTAMAMAEAARLRDELQTKLIEYESYGRDINELMTGSDEEGARRLVALRLQTKAELETLEGRYRNAKEEAASQEADYRTQERQVEERRTALPDIERNADYLAARTRMLEAERDHDLSGHMEAFDEAARDLLIEEHRVGNREKLKRDPNADLDRRIHETLSESRVDAEMELLRRRHTESINITPGSSVSEEDPTVSVRALLEGDDSQPLGEAIPIRREAVPAKKEG